MAKKAILGGFQAPGASPDPVRGGCFYINPSGGPRGGPGPPREGPEGPRKAPVPGSGESGPSQGPGQAGLPGDPPREGLM